MVLTTLFVGGIAIISHITAVAYPKWDGIDAHWEARGKSEQIQAYGSIWDFSVTEDSTNKFFYNSSTQQLMDTAWKTPIILMATTAIGIGIVGEGLIVLAALLEKCTKKAIVFTCVDMIAIMFLLIASFESLMGAILYKYNFTKHQAPKVSDVNYRLPYEEHGLRAGFYIECAAGGLFFVTSLLYIVDTVYAKRSDASSNILKPTASG